MKMNATLLICGWKKFIEEKGHISWRISSHSQILLKTIFK